jgi:hypothetical protein
LTGIESVHLTHIARVGHTDREVALTRMGRVRNGSAFFMSTYCGVCVALEIQDTARDCRKTLFFKNPALLRFYAMGSKAKVFVFLVSLLY